ncbi:hypothetical protein CKM354_001147300 [Cercospora kikuchii]|uniref:LysM domain-containing protein n=1 Tax=Cercospora kikuchii TaxID=84275 RepID=A0A9P3CTP5_9PEZI|nr:uncharacterized protein CKM354_001147300 [Cercospora kikuchii]GIZ48411.1 hypothetical protein CKM354_001147300 [Cercospora kikuchii]
MRTNLELPFQYTPAAAQEYLDTGLRCGMELPSIEIPAAYALNATAKVPLADNKVKTPLSCDRPYIVGSGDTCRSIAESQQVSTLGLIQANNLDSSCAPLPPVGGKLCLPSKCRVYVVQEGDNCFDIVTKNGVKASLSLKAWNPVINKKCNNFADLVDTAICVSEPGQPLPSFGDARTKQKLVQPDMNAPMGTRERRLAMELFAKDFRERILREDQEVARAREQNEAPDVAE